MSLLGHTPILGLPRKEVGQRRQRLPNDTKTEPEDEVACYAPPKPFHLLEFICKGDERDLAHHPEESNS